MVPTLGHLGPVPVGTHDVFVGLGVLAAVVVFTVEVRRRRIRDERLWVIVAGGLAGGLAVAGARLVAGFDLVADEVDLHDRLEGADLVVTGEGFLDEHSVGELTLRSS